MPVLIHRYLRHVFYRSLSIPDNPYGICGGQSGIEDTSSARALDFPSFVMTQILYTHPSTTDSIYV
jgi:hypothetical protein